MAGLAREIPSLILGRDTTPFHILYAFRSKNGVAVANVFSNHLTCIVSEVSFVPKVD